MKRNKRISRKSRKQRRGQNLAQLLSPGAQAPQAPKIQVEEPIFLRFGDDEEGCPCPICAELAHSGVAQKVMGLDGEIREAPAVKPPMMTVTIKAHRLSEYVNESTMEMSIPVGCCLQDLLEFVRYKNQGLMKNFAPCSLRATIDGRRPASQQRIIRAGQILEIDGEPDREWSRLLSPFPMACA